jgi:hypothetical protein
MGKPRLAVWGRRRIGLAHVGAARQLDDVKLLPRMADEMREVAETLRVPEPGGPLTITNDETALEGPHGGNW